MKTKDTLESTTHLTLRSSLRSAGLVLLLLWGVLGDPGAWADCNTCLTGYPYSSTNPLTSIAFNESGVLAGFNTNLVSIDGTIRAWYSDEHALLLGVRQVVVKTGAGSTTNDYTISPLLVDPSGVTNPAVGAVALSGAQAGADVSGRPVFPCLFVTDITTNSASTAGDWQWGGTPIAPHALFGTWKAAVRTVDETKSPPAVTVTADADPAKNDWDLAKGDPAPAGLSNQGYGAEVRWNVWDLGLQPGHSYRLYFMVHDGDQNQSGGDVGQGCLNVVVVSATGPVNQTNCPGDTVALSTSVYGIANYSLQWLKNGQLLDGQTNQTLTLNNVSPQDAATYAVVISSSCGSLTNSATLTITSPVAVTTPPASQAVCPGADASFSVSASGAGLAYQWFKDSSMLADQTGSSLELTNVSPTDAALYTVVVSGACGVPVTNTVSLTVNPMPSVTVNSPAICARGAAVIQANVSGDAGPFAFAWTVPATVSNPGNVDHFTATVPGDYSVVVTDANGCTGAAASGTLTVNPNPSVTVNNPTTCAGSAATIQASVSSGAGPFAYAWTVPFNASNPGNMDHFSAVVPGTYSVVVTDANGCTSAPGSGTLTANPTTSVSATANQPACSTDTGTITASASGSTGPYTYSLDGTTFQSSGTFSGLVANTYTVTVKDANGCTATEQVSIAAPSAITLTANPTQPVCSTDMGSINASASGGTGTITYSKDGSTFQPTGLFSGLMAGNYNITARDANGCMATTPVTINAAPATIALTATPTQPLCSADTGSINASAAGGTGTIAYSKDGTTFQPAGFFNGLTAGNYTITARDANGCTATAPVTINAAPAPITLTATPTQPLCSTDTGSINASASGGTGTITYSKDGTSFQPTGVFSGLAAGIYTITAMDANGCTATTPVIINPAPAPMALSITTVQPQCGTTSTGSITAAASGGSSPYTYSLDGTAFQASGTFSSLQPKTYTVTAKDANGCTCAQSALLLQPSDVSCTLSGPAVVQPSSTDNTISATGEGGSPPYSFSWSCDNPDWVITGTNTDGQTSTITYTAPPGGSSATFTVKAAAANTCPSISTMVVSCTRPSYVTDSSLCTFPSPFRLIFTQGSSQLPCYKLTSSNPGQFYYNMTYQGTPGQTSATFLITLPYPFITHGARPIHAYDSVTIQNSGDQTCLTPGNLLYASRDRVGLDSYGPNPVVGQTVYTFSETVSLSSLGFAYLNIHLDYGLEKLGDYTPGGTSGNDAVACSGSSVVPIPDLQADNLFYTFAYGVGSFSANTLTGVQSTNDFMAASATTTTGPNTNYVNSAFETDSPAFHPRITNQDHE